MSQRHEIPTHLSVADRAFLGLTMRQLLTAAIGLALAYGAASDLPLPLPARLALAALILAVTVLLALWRPVGRPLEDWAFLLVRFWAARRVATWRPRDRSDGGRELREIVLPEPRSDDEIAQAREGALDAEAS